MLQHATMLRKSVLDNISGRTCCATPSRLLLNLTHKRYYRDKNTASTAVPKTELKSTISNPTPPIMPGGVNAKSPPIPSSTPSEKELASVSIGISPESIAVPMEPSSPSKPWPTKLVDPNPSVSSKIPPAATVLQPTLATASSSTSHSVKSSPSSYSTAKPRHRIRKALLGLTLFTGISFAGGVYYSLKYDNFHDFFTEYIPFGEEAVLYFEEREFRKRFPNALSRLVPKKEETKVTIAQRSGATWKLHDPQENKLKTTDLAGVGPHIKSTGPEQSLSTTQKIPNQPLTATVIEEKPLPPSTGSGKIELAQQAALAASAAQGKKDQLPVASTGASSIDKITVPDDASAILKDLCGSLNSIIEVINKSDYVARFSQSVNAAKGEVMQLAQYMIEAERHVQEAAQMKLKEQELEFAKAAQGILSRVDQEAEQINEVYQKRLGDLQEELSENYERKLQAELERTKQLADQRLKNELLEQAIEMKRRWVSEIKDRVEAERDGRLGNLKSLNGTLNELENITSNWADAVETNVKTQQLHIAIEAVRNVVEDTRQPQPFIRELAALKEVAEKDEVVRAAIASINPAAYQKGVSSAAQLTDRFRAVSEEVRKAALLPESAGVAGHASSFILSKLLFRKKGLATGADVESILTRTGTYLEEGDLDNAAREMNGLEGWAKILATDWLRDARLLLEVKQALEVIRIQARLLSLRSS